ncbi:MAG: hypothetical protein SFV18_01350 [Bryobacteraceae bacterium]|nr:hypothetical protein [Bryobacteraceae bacterium]
MTIESPTIRISPKSKVILRDLAKREGKPMQTVLDDAIDRYRREKLLDDANAAYAKLRANPGGWADELAERQAWDTTSRDDE